MRKSLQLKISLTGITPIIWRRVVVNSDLTLDEMHTVIQNVMPWEESHLHAFQNKKEALLPPFACECEEESRAYTKAVIGDFLKIKRSKLIYEYDFGDSWMHNIEVEEVLPLSDGVRAKYIDGENMAPPEDCGGSYGFADLIEVLNDKSDPEYDGMRDWLGLEEGEELQLTETGINLIEINKILSKI